MDCGSGAQSVPTHGTQSKTLRSARKQRQLHARQRDQEKFVNLTDEKAVLDGKVKVAQDAAEDLDISLDAIHRANAEA